MAEQAKALAKQQPSPREVVLALALGRRTSVTHLASLAAKKELLTQALQLRCGHALLLVCPNCE